jgi:hypothetical protein
MMRQKINYFVDILLFIAFLITGITGLIMWRLLIVNLGMANLYFILPMGKIRLWHEWASFAMLILILIHLILHWNWMVFNTRRLSCEVFKKKS